MKNRKKKNKIKIFEIRKMRKINENEKIIISEIVNVRKL